LVIINSMLYRLQRLLEWLVFTLACILLLAASVPVMSDESDRARVFTRDIEFDYVGWTLDAAWVKIEQDALSLPYYLPREPRKQIVTDYLQLTEQIAQAEYQLRLIYTDPNVTDPQAASTPLREQLGDLYQQQAILAPMAESVLQEQISEILAEIGLTSGGQPIPPVLYHVSPIPMALVISPCDKIQQDSNISLLTNFTIDQADVLEEQVDKALNVSSLVVPIGGVGTYPTMVMRVNDLPWLVETIAHEWTHNFLTLRPLGLNYETTPQLRTMNETTAAIAGKEIGTLIIQRFYTELVSVVEPLRISTTDLTIQNINLPQYKPNPKDIPRPVFDFRAEMHTTRVNVDKLLAEGKINEAETYMKERRQFFWTNGYAIRKLNQAYFAFYGAYADIAGGAAGEDPVGPAVRALREQSSSLAEFVKRISWMTSFEQLKEAVSR